MSNWIGLEDAIVGLAPLVPTCTISKENKSATCWYPPLSHLTLRSQVATQRPDGLILKHWQKEGESML